MRWLCLPKTCRQNKRQHVTQLVENVINKKDEKINNGNWKTTSMKNILTTMATCQFYMSIWLLDLRYHVTKLLNNWNAFPRIQIRCNWNLQNLFGVKQKHPYGRGIESTIGEAPSSSWVATTNVWKSTILYNERSYLNLCLGEGVHHFNGSFCDEFLPFGQIFYQNDKTFVSLGFLVAKIWIIICRILY